MVMGDATKPQTLVHVLRHSFRPSEQLAHSLQEFILPKSELHQNSILIRSMAMVALDARRHHQHEFTVPLIEARKEVDRNQNISIPITRDIKVRKLSEEVLSILLRTDDKKLMYQLHRSLKNRVPEGTSLPENPNAKFFVAADLKSTIPFDERRIADAEQQYGEVFSRQHLNTLFSVYPLGISGMDRYVPTDSLDLST
jgi:hypothetical protein